GTATRGGGGRCSRMSIVRSSRSRERGDGFRSNAEHAEGFFIDGCVAGREAAENDAHVPVGLLEVACLSYRDPGGRFDWVPIDAGRDRREGNALQIEAGGEG